MTPERNARPRRQAHARRRFSVYQAGARGGSTVTGALLVDGQRFFQYIEGPPDGLEAVRRRIQDSRSHAAVAPVLDMAIGARAVPYWAMTRIETGQIVVSGLVNARWDEFGHSVPGMDQLVGLLRPHFPRIGRSGGGFHRKAQPTCGWSKQMRGAWKGLRVTHVTIRTQARTVVRLCSRHAWHRALGQQPTRRSAPRPPRCWLRYSVGLASTWPRK